MHGTGRVKSKTLIAVSRSSHQRCSMKTSASFFFNKVAGLRPWNFIKKETLAQVFSCEFCEVSKNTFFYRTPLLLSLAISHRGCVTHPECASENSIKEALTLAPFIENAKVV